MIYIHKITGQLLKSKSVHNDIHTLYILDDNLEYEDNIHGFTGKKVAVCHKDNLELIK